MYERSGTYKPRSGDEENIAELNYNAEENSTELEMEMVRDENERYWRCRHNFSHEYFDFVISLDSINMLELHKFRLSFFMTILIRSKDHISMALLAISL